MTKMFNKCPECGADVGRQWCVDRKLQQYCYDQGDCGWLGEPMVPEQKPLPIIKRVSVPHGGNQYEIYDKYGHILTSSRWYSTKKKAKEAMQHELDMGKKPDSVSGPHTGIIYPPFVKVKGEVFK